MAGRADAGVMVSTTPLAPMLKLIVEPGLALATLSNRRPQRGLCALSLLLVTVNVERRQARLEGLEAPAQKNL